MKEDVMDSVSKSVQLDVVELLKQVLQWTPLYKPGLNKALLQASKVGSLGCVKVLLSSGADADAEDENGDTPFVHAFRGRHMEVMEVLKEAGCTIEIVKMSLALATRDVQFVKFCHLLEIPVENEDWNCAEMEELQILLEELRIDPFVGQYGSHGYEDSPFMYLVQEGPPEMLQLLLDKHPRLAFYSDEDKHEKMKAALHKAIRHHRLDNVKLLVESLEADHTAKDSQGRTGFIVACGHDEDIAEYLLDKSDTSEADKEGLTPLHWACCAGLVNTVTLLTEQGVNVNAKAKLGATALMVACSGGHIEIVKHLMSHGAEVNAATPEGWTALHVAVWASAPTVVHLLIQAGAVPDVRSIKLTHNGDVVPAATPLLIAIFLNSMKIFHHLMDSNCDVDLAALVCQSSTNHGIELETLAPLQYAVTSRSWDFAELLIRAGAKVDCIKDWIMEDTDAPVKIPPDHRKTLKKMILECLGKPPTLKDLTRRFIRQVLGYHLVEKVHSLPINTNTKNSILMSDLFQPPSEEGSFEI